MKTASGLACIILGIGLFCQSVFAQNDGIPSASANLASGLNALAERKRDERKSAEAKTYALLALKEAGKTNDGVQIARAYQILGKVYADLQDFKRSREMLEQSARMYMQNSSVAGLAETLNTLGNVCAVTGDFEQGIAYLQNAAKLNLHAENAEGVATNMNSLGTAYKLSGNYDQALDYYMKAYEMRKQLGNQKMVAQSLTNLGTIFFARGAYEKSLDYFYQALKIFTRLGLKKDISVSLNNIGVIYITTHKLEKARECYQQSLLINTELSDKSAIARDLNNLGVVYLEENQDDKALDYFLQSYQLNLALGERYESLDALGNIALIYKHKKDYPQAIKYLNQTLDIAKEMNDKEQFASYYRFMGQIYTEQQQYQMAVNALNKALDFATELNSRRLMMEISQDLSDLYFRKGDFENSLVFYRRYSVLKDTIFNEASTKMMKEVETRYETEKKEKEILKLNEEKRIQSAKIDQDAERSNYQILIFVLSFLVLGGTLIIIFTRQRRKQREAIEKTIAQQEKLRFIAVMDAEERERKRLAQDLHDSLGQMLSTARLNMSGLHEVIDPEDSDAQQMYNNSISLVDESCSELRHISHNIMPTALIRLGLLSAIRELSKMISESQQLKVVFSSTGMEERLSENVEFALYRIVQELLSNIIKHADATEVTIQLARRVNEISLTVSDNGKGMDVHSIGQSEGLGWKSIYSRAAMLNGQLYITSEPGKGTNFQFSFTPEQ